MFVTVDKHQRFKHLISQTTSGLNLRPATLKLFVSKFKIAEYFFKMWVTMFSAV